MLLHVHRRITRNTELTLLPNEQGDGISFSNQQIIGHNKHYAPLYREFITKLSPLLTKQFNVTEQSAFMLARIAIVPVVHFFLDRLIRLDRLIKAKSHDITVANCQWDKIPTHIEAFCLLVSGSPQFNQALLCQLAEIYQLKVGERFELEQDNSRPGTNDQGFINYNFIFSGATLLRRARQRWIMKLSQTLGRIPAIYMTNARVPLIEKGLYGIGKLAHVPDDWPFIASDIDTALREQIIRPAISQAAPALQQFLRNVGVADNNLHDAILKALCNHCLTFYPSTLLESIPANMDVAYSMLRRFKGRTLISSGVGFNTLTAYAIAVAKSLDITVLDKQHGGHYGYIDDHITAFEGEYAVCDGIITWGWEKLPEQPTGTHLQAYAMPSPWLCYRQDHWQREFKNENRYPKQKPYDMLLMPNKLYSFPPAPCGAQSSVNNIQSFAAMLQDIIVQAAEQGIRVLHKPYNNSTLKLIPQTTDNLHRLGGNCYATNDRFDKGLTKELIAKCHIVVWDQPGTGFLECLNSGIATMVLWNRSYNVEMPWAKEIFSELETVGLIRNEVRELFTELNKFKTDPSSWMNDNQRKNIIFRFCQQYGRTEQDWPLHWRNFIRKLQ